MSGVTPGSAATEMLEYCPSRLYQRWASATVVATRVAPPIEVESPKSKTPEMTTGCTPCSVARPMASPGFRCLSEASLALIATVPSLVGRVPAMYVLRLKRGGDVEKTSVGAPPVLTDLPLITTAPLPATVPEAAATPLTPRT